jgi:acetyltransferase
MQLNQPAKGATVGSRAAAVPVLRGIRTSDEGDLQRFIRALSPASRYFRFMRGIRQLPEEMLTRFSNPEHPREAALVATSPSDGIIGLAQYVADDGDDGCEVALVVSDAWQRRGLGTDLLATLMATARRNDIGYVHADVLADNYAMRALAQKLGFDSSTDAQSPFVVRISRTLIASHETFPITH